MNDIPEVSFGIPRLTERLCIALVVERSRPYFVVPSILEGDFSFPMGPSVLIRRLNQLGLLPSDAEVCGDVDLIDFIFSRPSVTSHFNRVTYFDGSF